MKEKQPRWYRIWFYTSATWVISFCINLYHGDRSGWMLVLQFLNIFLCLGAGIVNRRRWQKENGQNEEK